MKLNNRIRLWRAKKNITQEKLARDIEMSRQTINSIERGKFIPSILTVIKLAKYFQTNIEELFFIEEDKP